MENKKTGILNVFIVLFVIILIVLFVLSLGSLNSSEMGKVPQAFKDSKDDAIRKHKRLKDHIAKQNALKLKLDLNGYFLVCV